MYIHEKYKTKKKKKKRRKKSETRQYRPCYITMFIESFAKRAHLELNIALYAFLIKTDLQVT